MTKLNLAVVGVVNHNNHILIGKKTHRENDILSEKWHVPGGKVELGEHPNEAIVREIMEETNINVKVSKVLDVRLVKKADRFVVVIWYECQPLETTIASSEELVNVKWIPKKEVFSAVDKEAVDLFPELVSCYLRSE